ncbi:MAG: hypothetical protein AB7J32_24345 [Pseudonocardia sp.]
MAKDPIRRRRRRRRLLVLAAAGGAGWYLWSRRNASEVDDFPQVAPPAPSPVRLAAAETEAPPVEVAPAGEPADPAATHGERNGRVAAAPDVPAAETTPGTAAGTTAEERAGGQEPGSPVASDASVADAPVADAPVADAPAADDPAPDPAFEASAPQPVVTTPAAAAATVPATGGAPSLPDGSAPGPEYTIKGNAGSRLFHPPSSPYYSRTKAEVWFRTPEEAREAGFTEYTPRRRAAR